MALFEEVRLVESVGDQAMRGAITSAFISRSDEKVTGILTGYKRALGSSNYKQLLTSAGKSSEAQTLVNK